MKKRALTLILAILLIAGFAACGQKQESSSAPVDEPTQTAEGPVAEEVMGVTVPEFTVEVNGVAVNNEMMADYPIYQVTVTTVNSSGTESTATYCGFALADVLKAAGVEGDFTKLTAVATDDYEIVFEDAKDLIAANTTLLAVTKDAKAFKEAPWLAPCTSGTSGDYLKGTATITVE